jgi:hypothetical protein
MNSRMTTMASSRDDLSRNLGHDDGEVGTAWRQFRQEDAATTAPAELERRSLAAFDGLQHRPRRSHRPSERRLFLAVGVVAGALLLALALHGHRATTVRPSGASSATLSAARDVEEVPAVITLAVDPVLETETLQLVRVRVPRLALPAAGVVVSEPNAEGFVEVDVVVGEDGLPRDVRRVALTRE